jgi:hypothetical protein
MNKFKLPAGRGNFSKTGHGVPTPFLQEKKPDTKLNPKTGAIPRGAFANVSAESSAKIDKTIELNELRTAVEKTAKNDSITASKARALSGGNKFQQGLQGNLAANRTRKEAGFGDMSVSRGKAVESGQSTAEGITTYTRNAPVIKEFEKLVYNPKTKQY